MSRITFAIAALVLSSYQLPALADDDLIEMGRHDERRDRRECRREEGLVGEDKRECRREEVRDGPRGHQDERQDARQDCLDDEGLVGKDKQKCKRDERRWQ